MMRFVWVTVPCAFLALAGCGDAPRPSVPAVTTESAEGTASREQEGSGPESLEERLVDWRALDGGDEDESASATPKPDGQAPDDADDPSADWPDVEDAPTREPAYGSGLWCGTHFQGRLPPSTFRELRLPDGRVIHVVPWVSEGNSDWIEPRADDDLWHRARNRKLTAGELEAMRKRIAELRKELDTMRLNAVARRSKAHAELLPLRRAVRREAQSWRQLGIDIDGVFYTSTYGESESAFLNRVRKEAAAKREARKQDAGVKADQGK